MTIIRQNHARNRFARRLDRIISKVTGATYEVAYLFVFISFNETAGMAAQVRTDLISNSFQVLLYIEYEDGRQVLSGDVTEPADRVTQTLTIQSENRAAGGIRHGQIDRSFGGDLLRPALVARLSVERTRPHVPCRATVSLPMSARQFAWTGFANQFRTPNR